MTREQFVQTLADLIGRDGGHPREREMRVRNANRRLYQAVVDKQATTAQADLALAEAAQIGTAIHGPMDD